MKDTEQALAQQLIAVCEALLKNTSRKDAELVRGALDLGSVPIKGFRFSMVCDSVSVV